VSAGSGITVTVNSSSASQVQATFSIAGNAAGGTHSVTANVAGQPSNSVNFYVQIPNHLVVSNDVLLSSSACSGGNGVLRKISYQIKDQNNPAGPVGIVPIKESFGSNISTNTCGNGLPTPSSCSTIYVDSSSVFTDILATNKCSPSNQSCGFSITPDQWQWCPSGQIPTTIGSPTYVIHWNQITVDGSATALPGGTLIP